MKRYQSMSLIAVLFCMMSVITTYGSNKTYTIFMIILLVLNSLFFIYSGEKNDKSKCINER